MIAELGHGGMADVYLAVASGPQGFSKLQVVKQLRPHLAEVSDFLAMFLDEARLAARLNHPNIVQTNEVGEEGGRYFIAMEYLDGQSLDRVIRRSKPWLSRGAYFQVLVDVLGGLHHAHELADYDGAPLSVVHRDVTPHNVFVTYEGQIKIVDFGIAKAANSSAETRTGVLKGKVAYMSPEQARGEPVDRRADLFSVGIMLWEATAGARLWSGLNDIQVLHRLANSKVPSASEITGAEVPPALATIIDRALAPDPADRYATAADMQADLERFCSTMPDRMTSREIGRYVADLFHDKRADMRRAIEERVRNVKAGAAVSLIDASTTSIPSAEMRSLTPSGSIPSLAASSSSPSHPSSPISGTPSSVGTPPRTSSLGSTHSVSSPPAPPRSRMQLVAVVAIGVAAAAGIFFATRGASSPPPASTPAAIASAPGTVAAPPVASVGSVGSPAPGADAVDVLVRTTPAGAKLFFDDRALGETPFRGRLPRDRVSHRLRIEAPGYVTRSENVMLEAPLDVELSLVPDPVSAPAAPGHRPGPMPMPGGPKEAPPRETAEAPAQPTTPQPPPRQKPKRALDKEDPWAN